jgi:hypothetical protein
MPTSVGWVLVRCSLLGEDFVHTTQDDPTKEEMKKRIRPHPDLGPCIEVNAVNDFKFCKWVAEYQVKKNAQRRARGLENEYILVKEGEGYTVVKEHNSPSGEVPFAHFRRETHKVSKEKTSDDESDTDTETDKKPTIIGMLLTMISSLKVRPYFHCTYHGHKSTATEEMKELLREKNRSNRIFKVLNIDKKPETIEQNYSDAAFTEKGFAPFDVAVFRGANLPSIFIDVQTRRSEKFHELCKERGVEYIRMTISDIGTLHQNEMDKCKLKGETFTDRFPACDKLPLKAHFNYDETYICDKCYPIWKERMVTCGKADAKESKQQLELEDYEDKHVANFDEFNKTADSASKTDADKMTETLAPATELEGKWMKIEYIRIYHSKWVHFFSDKTKTRGPFAVTAELLPKDAEPLLKKLSKISEALDDNARIMSSGKRKETDTPLFCFVKVKGLKYIVPKESNHSYKMIKLTNPADVQQGTRVPGAPGRS